MIVKELIEKLKELPQDIPVHYFDGEYQGSWSPVRSVEFKEASVRFYTRGVYLGVNPNFKSN